MVLGGNAGRVMALVSAVALCFALAAAPAVAQDSGTDPSAAQYEAPIPDGEEGGSASASDPGGDPSGLESNIGFLPFTGLDLLIVAGVALVLTGAGFALRRAASPRSPIG